MKQTDYQFIELMRRFDCTPRDAKIYLHALSVGPATIQQYAHDLHENRITVHSAVQKLIEKGLLFETRKGKHRLVAASDPNIFRRLTQQKRAELDLLEPTINAATTWLQTLQKTDRSIPSVKFYEGVDGLKRMLEESLDAKGEILVFTFVDLFSQLLTPKYLENYYIRRAKHNIHSRLIFPNSEFGRQVYSKAKAYKMNIRFLRTKTQWQAGFFAWNNVLAIQSFTEGKVTCTIIENYDIAFFYRNFVFDLCWQQASDKLLDQ